MSKPVSWFLHLSGILISWQYVDECATYLLTVIVKAAAILWLQSQ